MHAPALSRRLLTSTLALVLVLELLVYAYL